MTSWAASELSARYQAAGAATLSAKCESRVVLPEPAGAAMTVRRRSQRPRESMSSSLRRGRPRSRAGRILAGTMADPGRDSERTQPSPVRAWRSWRSPRPELRSALPNPPLLSPRVSRKIIVSRLCSESHYGPACLPAVASRRDHARPRRPRRRRRSVPPVRGGLEGAGGHRPPVGRGPVAAGGPRPGPARPGEHVAVRRPASGRPPGGRRGPRRGAAQLHRLPEGPEPRLPAGADDLEATVRDGGGGPQGRPRGRGGQGEAQRPLLLAAGQGQGARSPDLRRLDGRAARGGGGGADGA